MKSLAAALLLLPGVALAQPAWLRDALLIPAPPALESSDAAVLLDRTELVLDARMHVKRRELRAIRILKPAGVSLATFAFAVEPGGKRGRLKAWTIGTGRIEETGDKDVIETTLVPGQYSDVKQVLVRAPTPRIGDIVAAEFSSEEQLPFASYTWSPQPGSLPVARAQISVELPDGWTVHARASGLTSTESGADARRREYSVGPIAGLPPETFAPPTRVTAPVLMLRFAAPSGVAGGAMRDWQEVAAWYHGLASPHYEAAVAPPDLIARANRNDPGAALALLADQVQHRVGYAAIELGQWRWEPDGAVDTWTRHYGDCKDKAVLLVATLKASGIEARPVLARTREAGAVDPEWPDPGQFNHCIVAVATRGVLPESSGVRVRGPSGRTWWLFDPTDTGTPLGLLPWNLGGTYAVIADPAEGLVQIPRLDPGRIRFDLAGRQGENSDLVVTLRMSAERGAAGWLIAEHGEASDVALRERIGALFNGGGARANVTAVRWLGFDAARSTAALEADMSIAGVIRTAGRTLLVSPPFPLLWRDPPAADSARTLPYWMGWSPALDSRLELELPAGYAVAPRKATPAVHGPIGDYSAHAEEKDGRLVLERHLAFHEDNVPAARWSEAQPLLQAIYRGDNSPVLLKPRFAP